MLLKKKIIKFISTGILTGLIGLHTANGASAEVIRPKSIDFSGYEYIHSTDSRGLTIYWQHTHVNNKPTTDTVSYSVSRQAYSSANVSVSSTFNAMVEQVGVSTEVSLGASVTKITTISWTIPAYSTYTLRYGSRWAKASGVERYWYRGNIVSSKYVSGQWTYEGYSDSIKQ
ncbi:hypothetical protein [Tepidibacillus fermentans]|uniref:Uncharacterized protein n=1 Tax=Tepidibacillus fermentans TaxID=1281767 RepID=A0A4R3K708_9BACI|nr:hypothetical protein [Tepidibacillus fermentans]TCS78625.1 hypothetical protein EDD72_1263 [Tepidibacillus fermentans]